ncbi:MAG: hypothetical protein KC619_15805, partial [Myxococcales bacterium]|nr:hypothetical protein [Myxococcales bacterium]
GNVLRNQDTTGVPNTEEASDRFGLALATGDFDGDGSIDLGTEYNFGASVNAAKRDAGSTAPTDFMGQAWTAFRTGRALITRAGGALDDASATALREQRDLAVGAWEAAIAATVVHYVNEVLQVMEDFGTDAYDHERFLAHAKAWSELKGFGLLFQFNPRSPMSREQFASFHALIGDRPVLPAEGADAAVAYRAALRDARAILGTAYGFDPANLGDDAGAGGW